MLALLPASAAASHAKSGNSKVVGALYTETNGPAKNQVVVFNRHANGTLTERQAVDTGGQGGLQNEPGCTSPPLPAPGCPFLDAQGEVNLTPDGHLLFAVNAGSDTISSFRVTRHGLKLVDQVPSGGKFPNSITTHGNLLYVLNIDSLNIAGFRFAPGGKLTAIKESKRALSSNAGAGQPRQIGFDNTGRVLVVTLLGPLPANPAGPFTYTSKNLIDTFVVHANGTPGLVKGHDSTSPLPFGFAFDPRNNRLVISQLDSLITNGSAATYRVSGAGSVTPIDTEATDGPAPCWVAIPSNGRHAYVVNAGGGAPGGASVAQYKLSPSGKLKLLGNTPNLGEFGKTDPALSRDDRFLYVLVPGVLQATSRIDEYKVQGNGRLKLIGETPGELPGGVSGLAAR